MADYVKGVSREGLRPDPHQSQALCPHCRCFIQMEWIDLPDGSDWPVCLEVNGQEHVCAVTQPRRDARN